MVPGDSIPLIHGVLHLTYVQNTGAAFGVLRHTGPLLVLISFVVIVVLTSALRQAQHERGESWSARLRRYGMILMLAGAMGNVVDRLWLGYVVDFVDLRVWPVFNLADSAISVGIGLWLWSLLQEARSASSGRRS